MKDQKGGPRHPEGPGRRTYANRFQDARDDASPRPGRAAGEGRGPYEGRGPRVGRIERNVPRARRVSEGEWQDREVPEKAYRGGSQNRGNDLHRGPAWRSESGPGGRRGIRPIEAEAPEAAAPIPVPQEEDERLLAGRNPIREALKAGQPVEKLLIASGDLSGAAREIVRLAKEAGAVVQEVDRSRLDQIYPAHQGMLAYVAAAPYAQVEDILARARERGEDPFIVILDGVTDPHNLGAIIRSAECAGAHGVILPERRAAGLTPAAAKAAAGALSHIPVARVKNLNRTIEELKAENIWVTGTAMDGEDAFTADLTGPIALVIGSEGEGVSRLTLEKCDRTVSLPMKGHIQSLNASVAAGILMYEILRRRAK